MITKIIISAMILAFYVYGLCALIDVIVNRETSAPVTNFDLIFWLSWAYIFRSVNASLLLSFMGEEGK